MFRSTFACAFARAHAVRPTPTRISTSLSATFSRCESLGISIRPIASLSTSASKFGSEISAASPTHIPSASTTTAATDLENDIQVNAAEDNTEASNPTTSIGQSVVVTRRKVDRSRKARKAAKADSALQLAQLEEQQDYWLEHFDVMDPTDLSRRKVLYSQYTAAFKKRVGFSELIWSDTKHPGEPLRRLYKYEARVNGVTVAIGVSKAMKMAEGIAAKLGLKKYGLLASITKSDAGADAEFARAMQSWPRPNLPADDDWTPPPQPLDEVTRFEMNDAAHADEFEFYKIPGAELSLLDYKYIGTDRQLFKYSACVKGVTLAVGLGRTRLLARGHAACNALKISVLKVAANAEEPVKTSESGSLVNVKATTTSSPMLPGLPEGDDWTLHYDPDEPTNKKELNSLYGKSWYTFSKLQNAEVVLVDTLFPDESSKRLYKYEARLDGEVYSVAVAKAKKAAMGAAARVALKRLGVATSKKTKKKTQTKHIVKNEHVV